MSKIPQLATFIGSIDTAESAIKAGATHLILEDPRISARSYLPYSVCKPKFQNIADIIAWTKHKYPHITTSLNCDTLAHNHHIPTVETALHALSDTANPHVRIQDPGLLYLIQSVLPTATITLNTETGNQNSESILYHSQHFQNETLTIEMPHSEIQKLPASIKNRCGIQVHGSILIQYSQRRYMNEFSPISGKKESSDVPETIQKIAEDLEYPGRHFPFLDNSHGHFMYLYFDRCLIKYIPELMQLELNEWIIDGRNQSIETLKIAVQSYAKELFKYHQNPSAYQCDTTVFSKLETHNPRPLKPGFFRANKTDQDRDKNFPTLPENTLFLGTLKDCQKGEWVTFQTQQTITNGIPVIVITPDNKQFEITIKDLQDCWGNPITTAQKNQWVQCRWQKGMQVKSKLFIP